MWRGLLPGFLAGWFWHSGFISPALLVASAAFFAGVRLRRARGVLMAALVAAGVSVLVGQLRSLAGARAIPSGAVVEATVTGRRLPAGSGRGQFALDLHEGSSPVCVRTAWSTIGNTPQVGDSVLVLLRQPVRNVGKCDRAATRLLACTSCAIGSAAESPAQSGALLRDIWVRGLAPPPRWRQPPEFAALYDAGLGHLLAVSGLHVGFAAAGAWILAATTLWLVPWRWLAFSWVLRVMLPHGPALAGAIAGTWYVFARAGAPPSGVRAVLLLWVWLALRLLRRHVATEWRLLLVLAACQAFPHAVWSAGFAWSLLAVCWLVPLAVVQHGGLRWLAFAVLPWLGTLPLAAGGGAVAWAGPLANLVATGTAGAVLFPLAWICGWSPWLQDLFDYGAWLLFEWAAAISRLVPPEHTAVAAVEQLASGNLLLIWALLPLAATALIQRKSTVMRTSVVR